MDNFITIKGNQIPLTEEQVCLIHDALFSANGQPLKDKLSKIPVGNTFDIGNYTFVVLEHQDGETCVILKNLLYTSEIFGDNNNYIGSNVDRICNEFAEEIAGIIGKESLIEHTVDLTSDDGLKDYGTATRRMSLITADMYRKHVDTLDKHKVDAWWWTCTPYSTPKHENASWVKCVSPRGDFDSNYFYCIGYGVRPFCILKSDIFVSQ